MTIAAGTMMAAGAATSMIAANNARQVAKGNENANKNAVDDQIIENRKRATHDYLRDVRLEELQSAQENEALREKSGDIAKQTLQDKGIAMASAAERGVSGQSLDIILADFDFQQNQEVGRLRINQQMKDQQHKENAGGYADQFSARVTAVKPYVPRTQAPVDYFTPVFGLAGGLATAGKPNPDGTGGLMNLIGGTGTKKPAYDAMKDNSYTFIPGK